MTALSARDPSPTTSIRKVFLTLATSFIVAFVLGARGVVHAGNGMADGPARDATLNVGHADLTLAQALHLTGPWDDLERLLGRHDTPSTPPLLALAQPHTSTSSPPSLAEISSRRRWGSARTFQLHVPKDRPPKPHLIGVHRVTKHFPLRLLVTGDSLSGYLGPELINEVAAVAPVRGFTETHNGTGLTRPDFVDWSVVARQQVAADNPDAVVVFMGGNDFQNMTLPPNRFFLAGSPAWTREYQRRAAMCMRIWTRNGTRRVYWLSIPPARDPGWAHDDAQINIALARAARNVPGAEFVNVLGPVTNRGQYTDFVPVAGQPTLVREPDGVHLNLEGSTLVAHEVMAVIRREWHLP